MCCDLNRAELLHRRRMYAHCLRNFKVATTYSKKGGVNNIDRIAEACNNARAMVRCICPICLFARYQHFPVVRWNGQWVNTST
jgi:hypothetical protein